MDLYNNKDISGKLFKEKYLVKHHKEIYDNVMKYSIENNLINISFKEKVYCFINNIKILPICENPNCNNFTKYKNSTIGYKKYCSIQCISSDEKIKELKKNTSLEKYGVNSPAQFPEFIDKRIKTNLEKYGTENPLNNLEVRNKTKETMLIKYGVDNPAKNKELLNKRINSFKNSNYKENFAKTSLIKYGVEHPWKIKEIHDNGVLAIKSEFLDRINDRISDKYKLVKYVNSSEIIFYCNECLNEFNISTGQLYYRINEIPNSVCTNCFPISNSSSIIQTEFTNYIKEIYNGIVNENDKILNIVELDVYLPDLNIGFEFNGLYWHSNKFKPDDYHYEKFIKAKNKDILLYSFWEDDWKFKQNICKNYIKNIIIKEEIFIDNYNIRTDADKNIINLFLFENSLEDIFDYEISVCLFVRDELISVITLNYADENTFIIKNYCSLINEYDLLINYIIDNYNVHELIIYVDNMIINQEIIKDFNFIEYIPYKMYSVINSRKEEYRNNEQYVCNAGSSKYVKLFL
jgi:hypothetical protein